VLHANHTAAVVLFVVAAVALVVHAAIAYTLLRTSSLRLAVAAYLLYLDIVLILWCISEGRGIFSSAFLGFSILTRTNTHLLARLIVALVLMCITS
jgi:hypothetical protein